MRANESYGGFAGASWITIGVGVFIAVIQFLSWDRASGAVMLAVVAGYATVLAGFVLADRHNLPAVPRPRPDLVQHSVPARVGVGVGPGFVLASWALATGRLWLTILLGVIAVLFIVLSRPRRGVVVSVGQDGLLVVRGGREDRADWAQAHHRDVSAGGGVLTGPGWTLRVPVTGRLTTLHPLKAAIGSRIRDAQLDQTLAQLDVAPVSFGGVTLSNDGVKAASRVLSWSQVRCVHANADGAVTVEDQTGKASKHVGVHDPELLVAVVRARLAPPTASPGRPTAVPPDPPIVTALTSAAHLPPVPDLPSLPQLPVQARPADDLARPGEPV